MFYDFGQFEKSFCLFVRIAEQIIELIELNLYPYHLSLVFVLQLTYVIDIAVESNKFSLDHHLQIHQTIKIGFLPKVTDFVYQCPVELTIRL